MNSVALTCPQCAAPLPRAAQWRWVTCAYCGASVTRSTNLVQRAGFRERHSRALAAAEAALPAGRTVAVCGQRYRILTQLGSGSQSEVFLAQRIGVMPERVTLKLARSALAGAGLAAQASILRQLQEISIQGASFYTQHLPQVIALDANALVLRHPSGFWGSLAQVMHYQPNGIDPRHAVWMWRRILDVLAFVHEAGWAHGNISPEHCLVHPADHGIFMLGWSGAQRLSATAIDPDPGSAKARDLMQSACCIRMLLVDATTPGTLPNPLAQLIHNASEDLAWCAKTDARKLDAQLLAAARSAFGPPRFLKFDPGSPTL